MAHQQLPTSSSSSSLRLVRSRARHFHSRHHHRSSAPQQSPSSQGQCWRLFAAKGAAAEKAVKSKWWEKVPEGGLDNLRDVSSTQSLIEELSLAEDRLVVVDFYAQWCGACRALYPKLVKLAQENEDIVFLKVDYDANKSMCKGLGIKVLPFFHLYRGSLGRVDELSASVSKLPRLRTAIQKHNTPRCDLQSHDKGAPTSPLDVVPELEELERLEKEALAEALAMGAPEPSKIPDERASKTGERSEEAAGAGASA